MVVLKLLMVVAAVSSIFFLSFIYPNIKTPKWERKITSARYLRDRQHFDLADEMLENTMKEFPDKTPLYHVYYKYYSTPDNMQKIYDIFARGYELTKDAGLGVVMARMMIEEGDTDEAAEFLESTEAEEYMLTNNMPVKAELFYRQGNFAEAEKAFVDFYKKLYPDAENEKDIFSDFQPEELILLVQIRKEQGKDWRGTIKYLPLKSIMEEDDWLSLYQQLKEAKAKLVVTSGIHGSIDNLFNFRKSQMEKQIELLKEVL